MTRRLFLWLTLGLVAYLGFLVATFPAGWAYALARPQLEERGIVLYRPEGTVWNGRVAALDVAGRRLPAAHWRLRPAALLRGAVEVELALDERLRTTLDWDLGQRLRLAPLELQWDVPDLLRLLDLQALALGGRLEGRLERLEVAAGRPQAADGVLLWRGARTRLPSDAALGDLQLRLETTAEGIHGRFRDSGQGPLALSGTLQLDPQGQWRLSLQLTPREGRQSPLGRLLAFLGRPDAQGRVRLDLQGRLEQLPLRR